MPNALSRERIVEVAIELLDTEGEAGLTFRALADRLATGPGAIYWHIANKGALLVAATEAVVAPALDAVRHSTSPPRAIRAIAAGVFDAVDAHPWVGAQLSVAPSRGAALAIFERIGQQVQALGGSPAKQFTATSALVSYILGVSVQNAANARAAATTGDRTATLAAEAAHWEALDPAAYPFVGTVAARLRDHDDRAEFLAGLDLFLAGLAR